MEVICHLIDVKAVQFIGFFIQHRTYKRRYGTELVWWPQVDSGSIVCEWDETFIQEAG